VNQTAAGRVFFSLTRQQTSAPTLCSATTAHFDLFHPDFRGFWLNFHTTTAFPYPWGKI